MSTSHWSFDHEPILISDNEESISSEPTPPSSPIEPFFQPTPTPTPPKKTTFPIPQADPDSTPLALHALRANLCLDSPTCGSPKKDGGSCGIKIARDNLARAEDQVYEIVNLSPASPQFHDGLMVVAKTLHCRYHNYQRYLDLRVQGWMDLCLPTNPDENPAKALRAEIKKVLTFSSPICMICQYKIGGQKMDNCRQTIDEVCELAIDADSSRDIAYLLRVLRFNRLCPTHDKIKVAEITEWNSVIMAMFHRYHGQESPVAESLPHDDDQDHTHVAGGTLTPQNANSLDNSEASLSPPPSPDPAFSTVSNDLILEASSTSPIRQADPEALADLINTLTIRAEETLPNLIHALAAPGKNSTNEPRDNAVLDLANDPNYDLRTYWPAMSDESPLKASNYNSKITKESDSLSKARRLAKKPFTRGVRQPGFLYAYQVNGNPDYVKIGWSRSSAHHRRKKWQFYCNRKTTLVYPLSGSYAVSVPNAWRVEALCHAELAHVRVKVECGACSTIHQEWFKVTPEVAIKTIEKWSIWMKTEPYEQVMKGEKEVWRLKWEEMDRVYDLT